MFGMDFGIVAWMFLVPVVTVLAILTMLMPIYVMAIYYSIKRIERHISGFMGKNE